MIEMAKLNQAIKAKRKLEAVREKQKEVDTNNCWRKHYQLMFLLYHQRKEGQSKCELPFYTSQHWCFASSVRIEFCCVSYHLPDQCWSYEHNEKPTLFLNWSEGEIIHLVEDIYCYSEFHTPCWAVIRQLPKITDTYEDVQSSYVSVIFGSCLMIAPQGAWNSE